MKDCLHDDHTLSEHGFTDTGIASGSVWHKLADDVLAGQPVTEEQAEAILHSSDLELLDLISAAYRLRHRYFGNTVQLYFLVNAKSGLFVPRIARTVRSRRSRKRRSKSIAC